MGKQQRNTSFGQEQKLSIVDIFGKYLSEREIAKTFLKHRKVSMMLLDVGCGYHASILRRFSPLISHGVVVDMSVSEQVKLMNNVTVYEQPIEVVLPTLEFASFDAILMNSVLEHLDDPTFVITECFRVLKKEGVLIINVPTWFGKLFLEKSAYNFKLSPPTEMDDHKMYYDKRDLWPILVKAGFKPSSIKMKYYKFRLNLFSVCVKK